MKIEFPESADCVRSGLVVWILLLFHCFLAALYICYKLPVFL